MNKKKVMLIGAFPVAALLGSGLGAGSYALWQQSVDTGFSLATAQNTFTLTTGSNTANADAQGKTTLSLGGAQDARTLVDTGWMFYPVEVKWSSQGDRGVEYALNTTFPTTAGDFSTAERAVYDVTSDPTKCSASGWPGDNSTTAFKDTLEEGGTLRTSTDTKTKTVCVAFKLKSNGSYTNVGKVRATASNGTVVEAQDDWTVPTVPDPAKEQPFTLTTTTTYDNTCKG